jgi:hypothetical protein
MKINVHSILIIWGRMARAKGIKGYPQLLPFLHENATASRFGVMTMSDEDFEKIDKIFCQLHKSDFVLYQILGYRYVYGYDDKAIWHYLAISRRHYYEQLKCAQHFIAGALSVINLRV